MVIVCILSHWKEEDAKIKLKEIFFCAEKANEHELILLFIL